MLTQRIFSFNPVEQTNTYMVSQAQVWFSCAPTFLQFISQRLCQSMTVRLSVHWIELWAVLFDFQLWKACRNLSMLFDQNKKWADSASKNIKHGMENVFFLGSTCVDKRKERKVKTIYLNLQNVRMLLTNLKA